jgi:hypothetical protein
MLNAENALKKWASIIEHTDCAPIQDAYRKSVTAVLLENTEKALQEEHAALANSNYITETTNAATTAVADPVLISMVRRAMPQLIAYDICGVQPMTGPTGLIFAMKARQSDGVAGASDSDGTTTTTGDAELLFDEADGALSGADATTGKSAGVGEGAMANAGFTIEKTTVTALTRSLKAEYTMELAQDLKAVHGLDAESELANILSQEILAEINREVIKEIRNAAFTGAVGSSDNGNFDLIVDADGRWAVERFQSLAFQLEKESNAILVGDGTANSATRRGKGNFAVVHSDVASALAAAGRLSTEGVLNTPDYGQNTFVGQMGNMKVYVDPYAASGDVIVGYRGAGAYDAGFFYAPYVPLTMVKAVSEENFQPRIAFKTRYGTAHNPIVSAVTNTGTIAANSNPYFRNLSVTSINDLTGS